MNLKGKFKGIAGQSSIKQLMMRNYEILPSKFTVGIFFKLKIHFWGINCFFFLKISLNANVNVQCKLIVSIEGTITKDELNRVYFCGTFF